MKYHSESEKKKSTSRDERRKAWDHFVENEAKNIRMRKIPFENIVGPDTLANIRVARKERYTPHFFLFTQDGNITQEAIDSLELTQAEQSLLSKLSKNLVSRVQEELRNSVKYEPEKAKARGAIKAFSISPFEDQLAEPFNQLGNQLAELSGRERAGKILLMIPVDLLYNHFGRDEVIGFLDYTELTPGDADTKRKVVTFEVRDGQSGSVTSTNRYMDTSLKDVYPGLFEDDLVIP